MAWGRTGPVAASLALAEAALVLDSTALGIRQWRGSSPPLSAGMVCVRRGRACWWGSPDRSLGAAYPEAGSCLAKTILRSATGSGFAVTMRIPHDRVGTGR